MIGRLFPSCVGVMGGPVLVKVDVPGSEAAGEGLKKIDPARYGSLEQPGDGFSFDIFTQLERLRSVPGSGHERDAAAASDRGRVMYIFVFVQVGLAPDSTSAHVDGRRANAAARSRPSHGRRLASHRAPR